jgi:murein DD-endopeptidase MepM/ murein hydrolase activator NlpD
MDKKLLEKFWSKRSAWTFGLCLAGVLVIGSIVAVDKVGQEEQDQPETVIEQAYLDDEENDLQAQADANDTLLTTMEEEEATIDKNVDVSGTTVTAADTYDSDVISEEMDAGLAESVSSDNNGDSVYSTDSDFTETASDTVEGEPAADEVGSDTAEAASTNIVSEAELIAANVAFDTEENTLLWPAAGTILIDYSMDGSVFFPTLNQYKYNPALIIGSETGNQVVSAARGIVESVAIDEETGLTMTVNIGNGYRLIYGQLKETTAGEGEIVEAGTVLGYVSEPTRYYIKEGSNLYFEMTKDGEPVDPVLYLE